MWKNLFSEIVLIRGYEYFMKGLVDNVSVSDDKITASVYGTKTYNVEISKEENIITSLRCDCPYARDGNHCKHLAATLYYVSDNEKYIELEKGAEVIEEIVNGADMELIKSYLINVLKGDKTLLREFKKKINYKFSIGDVQSVKQEINDIINSYNHSAQFIDYNDAYDLMMDLIQILENEIIVMIQNNLLEDAFDLSNYMFVKIMSLEMDDSAGGTSMFIDECLNIWDEILSKSDFNLKKNILDKLIDSMHEDYVYDISYYIEDFIFNNFNEKEFWKLKLNYIDKNIRLHKMNDGYFDSYLLNRYIFRKIDMFEIMNTKEKDIIKYYEKHINIKIIRDRYIDLCIKNKDYNKAIKLINEFQNNNLESSLFNKNYMIKLKEIYKLTNQDDLYKETLYKIVINVGTSDLAFYKELKKLYSKSEWEKKREKIFKEYSLFYSLENVYVLEGLHDRLFKLIKEKNNINVALRNQDILKDKYSKELLKIYEIELNKMVEKSSTRNFYREIVSILKTIKGLEDGNKFVLNLTNEWKEKYKSRKAFLDELNRL